MEEDALKSISTKLLYNVFPALFILNVANIFWQRGTILRESVMDEPLLKNQDQTTE